MSACRFRKVAIAATAFLLGFCVASHAGEVLLDRKAPSPTLGHDIPYTLYRPDPDPSGRKWPVVYLFHGLNGTERDWLDAGRLKETVDRLIASRRIKPLIVVMPMAGNGWYVDNPDPGGAGELSRAFTHDLVAHVEQSYTAAPCRAARALGGLSMGGYGALLYAMDNPARYAAAFGMSASIFRPMPEEADERARRPTHMFNGAFGQPFGWQRFNRWNLFPRLPTYIANPDRPAFYLAVGEDDFPGLKAGNMAFHKALTEAGVATPFRKDPGGHVWPLWDAQLEPALIWLDGILSASCPSHGMEPIRRRYFLFDSWRPTVRDQLRRTRMPTLSAAPHRPRVVIVGAGFGGLSAAKALGDAPVDVTVIDLHNYHLFQPLLYQVATAGLSPADIAAPIRSVLRGQSNTSVMLAKVTGVDMARNEVVIGARRVPFDFLVLATGARHAYFGNDDWEMHAHGIKKIDDATHLRRKILLAFERAESENDPTERRRLLNFVVIGGGATGVEMAGAIAELSRKALAADFRTIDPRCAQVTLLEAGPRLLPAFDERLSETAQRSLERLGVEHRLNATVTGCDASGVSIGPERIETRTIVWGAGVRASAAGKWLGSEADRVGRVKVTDDLSVAEHPNVFVIGDTAHVLDREGKPLPGVAPVAKQQGAYVAKLIWARLREKTFAPFRYRDFGSMATIGRKSAVAQLGRIRLSGYLAWWLWGLAHIYFLIGFRNRAVVAMNWAWNYVSFQRGTRLITGADPELDPVTMAPPPAPALRESA